MSTLARWVYGAVLALCPRDFRRRFAARMRADFEELMNEATTARARLKLALRESADVVAAAWRSHRRGARATSITRRRAARWERSRQLLDDLRFAWRTLAARPAYTFVGVSTLALGIGAGTIVFSVIDKVVIQPLPYADSERMVWLWAADLTRDRPSRFPTTPADFLDWRERSSSFEEMVASRSRSAVLTGGTYPERIVVAAVSDGTFDMLGVDPLLGARLDADSTGTDVLLSHATWQQVFGGDADVVGRSVQLDGTKHTIVGVMPPGFRHLAETSAAMWQPLRFGPAAAADRTRRALTVLAKLTEGVGEQQARSEMSALAAALAEAHPVTNATWGAHVLGIKELYLEDSRRIYVILAASVALVLLIACINLASLVLARGAARRAELDLRHALGATRARIVRLLVTEGCVIAAGGATAGSVVAVWGLARILPLAPSWPLVLRETAITGRSLAFVVVAAALSLLTFSVLPALRLSRRSLRGSLTGSARAVGASARDLRFRRALVVAQMGLAVVLMIGAGLLVRSVINIINADNGFDYRGVVAARVLADVDDDDARAYFEALLEHVGGIPGVRDVALADAAPMDGSGDWVRVYIDGKRMQEERALGADYRRVTPGYFETLAIERTAGRLFTAQDGRGERVAVINEDFARRFLAGRDPLGTRVSLAPAMGSTPTDRLQEWRIIGVVESVQEWGPVSFVIPMIYVPFAADPSASMSLLMRTDDDAESLLEPLRALVREVGDSPVYRVRTLASYLRDTYETQRFLLTLLGTFATLAALLAGVGLYGVMAYNVVQRRREIGVRVALGAQRGEVLRMIVRQGGLLAAIAVAVGIAGAVPIARGLSTALMGMMLVGIDWLDPATFIAVPLFVLLTGLLASWLPARRAARVDPVTALRSDA